MHNFFQDKSKTCIILLLDTESYNSEEFSNSGGSFRAIADTFETFSDPDISVDFLTDSNDALEKFFVILSKSLSEKIVPIIHSITHLHSIYIYAANEPEQSTWIKDYEKIRGQTWTDLELICEHIKEETSLRQDEFVAISFLSPLEIDSGIRQDPFFMYSQLLQEILLDTYETDSEEQARSQMLKFCREYHIGNLNELKIIDEFEGQFYPENSVYWYTRECFLHRMLNRALWIPEPDVLYQFRYFLRHFNQFIRDIASVQSMFQKSITVYRGQGLSVEEFSRLKHGIGGLISFRSFLSTSLNRAIALQYAEPFQSIEDKTSVLFSINVDTKIETCRFVNVGKMSYYEEGEQEVLFTIGAVFRVEAVEQIADNLWEIRLASTSDTDMNLTQHTEEIRQKISSNHPLISLIKLVDAMGQYKLIGTLAKIFIENASALNSLSLSAEMQEAIGSAYLSAGNQTDALKYLQEALNTYLQCTPNGGPSLSSVYNSIGDVHYRRNNNPLALENYKKALEYQLNSHDQDFNASATYAENIAGVHRCLGNLDDASEYENLSLRFHEQHRTKAQWSSKSLFKPKEVVTTKKSPISTDMVSSMNRLMTSGQLGDALGPYWSSILRRVQSQNAAKEEDSSALSNLSCESKYAAAGRESFRQGKINEAFVNFQKALELDLQCLSDDHPTIARSHYNLATVYVAMSQYDEALNSARNAVEQCRKKSDANIGDLSSYICQIGDILAKQDKHSEAVEYFKEGLAVKLTDIGSGDEKLAADYNRLAETCEKMENYSEALTFYEKELEIQTLTCDDDDASVARTHNKISKVYLNLSKLDEAFKHAEAALEKYKRLSNQHQPSLGWLMYNVGDILHRQGNNEQAISYLQDALPIIVASVEPNNQQLANVYYRLAEVYFALSHYKDALTFYQNTLEVERSNLTEHDPTIATTYEKLGDTLTRLRKRDEAIDHYLKGVDQLLMTCSADHADVKRLRWNVENMMRYNF